MRTLALASLLALAVSGCRLKGDPSYESIAATCAPVTHACSDHSQCCSFACVSGVCVANALPGGVCRSSDDCAYTLTCVQGRCQTGYTCSPSPGDVCASNNECCSGNCLGENTSVYPPTQGTCGTETRPVVALGGPFTVPYYVSTTLHATVSDPDPEDVFAYAWDVVSAPTSALSGWTSSAAAPTVTPSVKGTYVLRLRVADGPSTQRNRLTSDPVTVTLVAVNLAPVVDPDPTHLPTVALRNTPISLVGAVSDPNGTATPVSCAWYARPAGQAEISTPIASWTTCPANPSTTYTTPIEGPQGVWEFRLQASDGELTTSAVRAVDVRNAAPVALACAYECLTPPGTGVPLLRVGNLGPPGEAAPPVPLHGSATDDNHDVGTAGFSWSWSLVSAPPGSSGSAALVRDVGTGPAPPFDGALDPDVAGTYVVRLHVDDGWTATADADVTVVVEPFLRPLPPGGSWSALPRGSVADAAYLHAASAAGDRLVLVGHDLASGLDRLWVVDPEASATAAVPAAALAEAPRCVGLDPSGASALVGGTAAGAARWERVTLGATPSGNGANPFAPGFGLPNDVVDTGGREYAVSDTGLVHELLSSGTGSTSSPPTCDNCAASVVTGSHAVGATDALWLLSPTGLLRRFTVRPNGNLSISPDTYLSTAATDLWLSSATNVGQEVVVSSGGIFDATTLNPSGPGALPVDPARHLDTASPGGGRQGILVDGPGAAVLTLDGSYSETGRLRLPRVGYLGTGYPLEAVWAFVRSDGGARYVVLRATVDGAVRWYLARY